jgi:hypothetical protein
MLLSLALCVISSACSSKNGGTPQPPDETFDAGPPATRCENPQEPIAGMSEPGSAGFTVEVLDATPALASVSGTNEWTLVVKDSNGKPVDGLNIDVRCGMKKHSHGCGGTGPKVTALGGGQYKMSSIIFIMAGDWYMNLTLTNASTSDAGTALMDTAVLSFCVQ